MALGQPQHGLIDLAALIVPRPGCACELTPGAKYWHDPSDRPSPLPSTADKLAQRKTTRVLSAHIDASLLATSFDRPSNFSTGRGLPTNFLTIAPSSGSGSLNGMLANGCSDGLICSTAPEAT